MDMFYRPPVQRQSECRSLEDNYMNCLFQKALKDKVTKNNCKLDGILWFHLECPKAADQFDDPIEYKRKFRDFFAQNKAMADDYLEEKKNFQNVVDAYGHIKGYPEAIKHNPKGKALWEDLKHISGENGEINGQEIYDDDLLPYRSADIPSYLDSTAGIAKLTEKKSQ
mmetsp:Transcript_33608/g.51761  ORF Transcript_33608/g.51761 Transcript_33608/m.51761 type:complete len:168 (-) Transcript_33608:58-561(-)